MHEAVSWGGASGKAAEGDIYRSPKRVLSNEMGMSGGLGACGVRGSDHVADGVEDGEYFWGYATRGGV